MLDGFCDWLSNTAVSTAFQSWTSFVPLVQTAHILAIGVLLVAAFTMSFRLLGLSRSPQSLALMTERAMPWTWGALMVLLCTGVLLTITEPSRELLNIAFRTKMAMVVLLAAALYLHQSRMRADAAYWTSSSGRRRSARALGIALLLLGTLIVIAGRWIAYV